MELRLSVLLLDVLQGDVRWLRWQTQWETLNRTLFYIIMHFPLLQTEHQLHSIKKINWKQKILIISDTETFIQNLGANFFLSNFIGTAVSLAGFY